MKKVRWIGLAKVSALNNDILEGASGAYVNALAFANNKLDFRKKVKNKLAQLGLELKRLEDAEPFKDRVSKDRVSKEISRMSKRLSSHKNIIAFSKFHTYP